MIELVFPSATLSPNGRAHWGLRARAAKRHRQWAARATQAALGTRYRHRGGRVGLLLTAYPPSARRMDQDNMIARLKSSIDGIADALGVDDSLFDVRFQWGEPVKGGKVVVSLDDCEARPIGEIVAPIMADIAQRVEEA